MRARIRLSEIDYSKNPLYLFDNEVLPRAGLTRDYTVPKYFQQDFFNLLEGTDQHRPSFRWLLVGKKQFHEQNAEQQDPHAQGLHSTRTRMQQARGMV
jgi:hypothetical protein